MVDQAFGAEMALSRIKCGECIQGQYELVEIVKRQY